MLFLNKKQVTGEELVDEIEDMFDADVPFDKIMKAPVFIINPKRTAPDTLNGGLKVPAGSNIQSFFIARTKGGATVEIRYASSTTDEIKAERMITTYSPRKILFTGTSAIYIDLDQALYMWLYPLQATSPFYVEGAEPFHYQFEDKEATATENMLKITALTKALNYITTMSGDHLRTIAKGLGLQSVNSKSDLVIQSELSLMAQVGQKGNLASEQNPAGYFNDKVRAKDVLFDGIVANAIDNDIFKLKTNHAGSSWYWNAGTFSGERVMEIITKTKTPEQLLKEHIRANIQNFYSLLMDLMTKKQVESKVDNFLDNQDDFNAERLFGSNANMSSQQEQTFNILQNVKPSSINMQQPQQPDDDETDGPAMMEEEPEKETESDDADEKSDAIEQLTTQGTLTIESKQDDEDELPDFLKAKPASGTATAKKKKGQAS
jgi:hypothetical protein